MSEKSTGDIVLVHEAPIEVMGYHSDSVGVGLTCCESMGTKRPCDYSISVV